MLTNAGHFSVTICTVFENDIWDDIESVLVSRLACAGFDDSVKHMTTDRLCINSGNSKPPRQNNEDTFVIAAPVSFVNSLWIPGSYQKLLPSRLLQPGDVDISTRKNFADSPLGHWFTGVSVSAVNPTTIDCARFSRALPRSVGTNVPTTTTTTTTRTTTTTTCHTPTGRLRIAPRGGKNSRGARSRARGRKGRRRYRGGKVGFRRFRPRGR